MYRAEPAISSTVVIPCHGVYFQLVHEGRSKFPLACSNRSSAGSQTFALKYFVPTMEYNGLQLNLVKQNYEIQHFEILENDSNWVLFHCYSTAFDNQFLLHQTCYYYPCKRCDRSHFQNEPLRILDTHLVSCPCLLNGTSRGCATRCRCACTIRPSDVDSASGRSMAGHDLLAQPSPSLLVIVLLDGKTENLTCKKTQYIFGCKCKDK